MAFPSGLTRLLNLRFLSLPLFIDPPSTRKLHPTSYLDGLRGFASFFVVIHHYAGYFTDSSGEGWYSPTKSYLFQLPLLRVVHSGRFMVQIFFVISGYVLSYRGLKLAREGQKSQLLDSLSSSVLRRWIRLFVPAMVSTIIGLLLGGEEYNVDPYGLGYFQGSFTQLLYDWFHNTQQLVYPVRDGLCAAWTKSKYNPVLWTIPIEFQGSMFVFLLILGTARTKSWIRRALFVFLIYWSNLYAHWEAGTFITGILLADLSFSRSRCNEFFLFKNDLGQRMFWTCLFSVGVYIGSAPQDDPHMVPGYRSLTYYTPTTYRARKMEGYFWPFVGAFLLVFSLDHSLFLQNIFTTRFAQYLGNISFSLYLLHFQVLHTVGKKIMGVAMVITGGWENRWSPQLAWVLSAVGSFAVVLPVTFWVSEAFTRWVDDKAVLFARWVDGRVSVEERGLS